VDLFSLLVAKDILHIIPEENGFGYAPNFENKLLSYLNNI
jgi:hypothetical protein